MLLTYFTTWSFSSYWWNVIGNEHWTRSYYTVHIGWHLQVDERSTFAKEKMVLNFKCQRVFMCKATHGARFHNFSDNYRANFCGKEFVAFGSMENQRTSQHWHHTVPTTTEPLWKFELLELNYVDQDTTEKFVLSSCWE